MIPPTLCPLFFTEDRAPLPQPLQLLTGRREGEVARRGSVRSSPPACHQSRQALGVAAQGWAVAMEPLETPIKDGILYQQHTKFGKVGPWRPGSCLRKMVGFAPVSESFQGLGEWGRESGWGSSPSAGLWN